MELRPDLKYVSTIYQVTLSNEYHYFSKKDKKFYTSGHDYIENWYFYCCVVCVHFRHFERPDYIKIHTARLFKVWNLIGFVLTRKRRMFCCQAFLIGPKVSVKGTPMYSVPRSHYLDNSLRNMAVLK